MKNKINWPSTKENLRKALIEEQKNIQLKDTPFYPLVFHAEMPEESDFENGHLSFRFKDFRLSNLDKCKIKARTTAKDSAEVNINLTFNEAILQAIYEVNSKQIEKNDLDTGGNYRAINSRSSMAAGAKDQNVKPLSQKEIDDMVTQARAQKDNINATHHGQGLMTSYDAHKEAYNTAFVTLRMLRDTWSKGGVTTQMSRDTHQALNDGTIVNSKTKKYANGQTYNQNALVRQAAIVGAMYGLATKEKGNTALADKYDAAARAAIEFKKNVNSTGKDNSQPAHLTGEEVYDRLKDQTISKIEISDAEYKNMINQSLDDYSKDGGADAEALKNGWKILRNEEREMLREYILLFQEEILAQKEIEPALLWSGNCSSPLSGTQANITSSYDEKSKEWKVKDIDVQLPGFALEIDDAHWAGKTADIVRERLANIHFVKSLLKSKIQKSLHIILERAAIQSLVIN